MRLLINKVFLNLFKKFKQIIILRSANGRFEVQNFVDSVYTLVMCIILPIFSVKKENVFKIV